MLSLTKSTGGTGYVVLVTWSTEGAVCVVLPGPQREPDVGSYQVYRGNWVCGIRYLVHRGSRVCGITWSTGGAGCCGLTKSTEEAGCGLLVT